MKSVYTCERQCQAKKKSIQELAHTDYNFVKRDTKLVIWGRKKLSSAFLGSVLGGLQIKLTEDRLMKTDFIMDMCIGIHKEM